MRLTAQKTTPPPSRKGRGQRVSSGSESTAGRKSEPVNVGDPDRSSRREVSMNECNSEAIEMTVRKSEGA